MHKIKRKLYVAYLKFIRHRWEGYKYSKSAKLPDTYILPTNSFYYLGLVAIFRGEDDYLVEWIELNSQFNQVENTNILRFLTILSKNIKQNIQLTYQS